MTRYLGAPYLPLSELRKNEMPGIDLLREVAVALEKKNLELYQFVRSMRLKNMLDMLNYRKKVLKNS